jgi:hypothetical protein
VGAARVVLRCLLLDCFAFVFAFALVLVLVLAGLAVVMLAAVRNEEGGGRGGSEPIVAVVEILEYVEVSLVVDPMVAIVEVLRSADGLGTLLDAGVAFEMVSSMLAIAYVL